MNSETHILPIEDLLDGKGPEMFLIGANVTFQKAERVKKQEGKQERLL